MKSTFSTLFILCFSSLCFSQNSKLSATLSYPIAIGDNLYKLRSGVVDVGIQYRFLDLQAVLLGASINGTLIGKKIKDEDYTNSIFILSPKAFLELSVIKKFKPFFGIGYTYVKNHEEFDGGTNLLDTNGGGLGINIGASLSVSERFAIIVQYDYAKPNFEQSGPYYNLNMLKLGVGYSF